MPVAEMSLNGALFHLNEEIAGKEEWNPESLKGTSKMIGLFAHIADEVLARAVGAGGKEPEPVKDYDFQYRQGCIVVKRTHLSMTGILKRRLPKN